ncbi:MAG: sialate O-acetylesterase [Sphingomonadales bacterium]|nr:sialate O-acetylesterase [Sphingomonadales bacterium]
MHLSAILSGLLLIAFSAAPAVAADGKTYRVYFLGGQSNMEGYGHTAELAPAWTGEHQAIRIFNGHTAADGEAGGGVGLWAPLRPGYGVGFRSDGRRNRLSDRFGPELAFGVRIAELNPGENIALVKYARGGSSLALGASHFGTWAPEFSEANGRNQYDNALTAIETAFSTADIDGDGHADRLIPAGIIWMQGESDAYTQAPARAYEQNLRRMMDLLRAALRVDDLPVVIGRITDSGMDEDGLMMDHIALVQRAQAAYVAADACAAYVSEIDEYQHSDDGWHYVSADYIRMGRAFAEAVHALAGTCR